MGDYAERRHGWERRFEDVLIEMMKETTEDGFQFLTDQRPVINEFTKLLNQMDSCRKSKKRVFIPGNRMNED